jgi:hypothetical protein
MSFRNANDMASFLRGEVAETVLIVLRANTTATFEAASL